MEKIRIQKYFKLKSGAIILLFVCSVNAANSRAGKNKLLLSDSFSTGKSVSENSRLLKEVTGNKKYLRGDEMVIYPLYKYFNYRQGTVEFSISFTSEAEIKTNENWAIFRASADIGEFANTIMFIRGWGNGLFLLLGDKKGNRTILPCPEIKSDWKINKWHHIAFSWKLHNPGKTEIAFYLDGKLIKKEKNITLEMDEQKWKDASSVMPNLGDWNSFKGHVFYFGNWGGKGVKGARLGNLKIYNYVRNYEKQKFN